MFAGLSDVDFGRYGSEDEDYFRFSGAREGYWLGRCADCPVNAADQSVDRTFAEVQEGSQLAPRVVEDGRPAPAPFGLSAHDGYGPLSNGDQEAQASPLRFSVK